MDDIYLVLNTKNIIQSIKIFVLYSRLNLS